MKIFLKNFFKQNNKSLIELGIASLTAVLVITFVVTFADISYRPKNLKKRGFEIEIDANGKAVAKKEEKPVDLAELMKIADLSRGEKVFKKCASCHNATKGSGSKVGPSLYSVIGRARGSFSGFSYSQAMKEKGGSWDRESISQFIAKPKEYLPGTKMAFPGLKKPQERADVILYLESQK